MNLRDRIPLRDHRPANPEAPGRGPLILTAALIIAYALHLYRIF